MAQNVRIRTLIEESDNSDYESSREHSISTTYTPGDGVSRILWTTASGAATTFYLDHLSTCTYLVVENLDTSTACELKFTTGAGTTDAVMDLPAGGHVKLVDIDPSANLVCTPASGTVQLAISYGGAV